MAARKKVAAKAKGKTTAKKRPVAAAKRKAPAKKVTKAAVSRATSKKASKAAKPALKAISVGRKPFNKSQFVAAICENTGVARKDVVCVLESISHIIKAHVQKHGPEIFSWPGMLKIKVVKKPPTKARQGINPFTGEPMMFKAKPASRKIKILALKQLKEMAS